MIWLMSFFVVHRFALDDDSDKPLFSLFENQCFFLDMIRPLNIKSRLV